MSHIDDHVDWKKAQNPWQVQNLVASSAVLTLVLSVTKSAFTGNRDLFFMGYTFNIKHTNPFPEQHSFKKRATVPNYVYSNSFNKIRCQSFISHVSQLANAVSSISTMTIAAVEV